MNLEFILIAGAIILIAGIIKDFSGFGTALFSVPLLALFLDIKFIVLMFALVELYGNGFIAVQNLKFIHRKTVGLLLLGIFFGVIIGTYFLVSFSNEILKQLLGLITIIFAIHILFQKRRHIFKKVNELWAPIIGSISGFFSALFSTAGPPIVMYCFHQFKEKRVLRATMVAIFFITSLWGVILALWQGIMTMEMFLFALYMIPFIIVGLFIGNKVHLKVDNFVLKNQWQLF